MGRRRVSFDEEDEDSDSEEVTESTTPKMNKFVHDLCDWLLLVTLVFLVGYGILYAFYEIALGMAHIRWVYNAFLIMCILDAVVYLLTRFAVVGGETNYCLVVTGLIFYVFDLLVNLAAPAVVLWSYELTLEHPSGGSVPNLPKHGVTGGTNEYAFGDAAPQDCRVNPEGFKCGVVKSIRTSIWCMYLLLIPRPLVIYGIISILRNRRRRK